MTKQQTDAAGHFLKTGWILLALVIKHFDQVRREVKLEKTEKNSFNFIIKKLESVDVDLKTLTSTDLIFEVNKEISQNWEVLSVMNVLQMMSELDDKNRVKVELFTEQLYKEYLLTK